MIYLSHNKIIIFHLLLLFFFSMPVFAQYHSESFSSEQISLDTINVTSDRPEYEKLLSPGTVSWIEPKNMVGEQKDLPSLLERVPGVMVRRQGTGQYAYATIRGSTGSQVSVFVDGVAQNTGGSQTVDLSLIPVHNIVRIEIFRGYIPSRFSGAPIGGIINIITQKPESLGAKVEAGVRSFGGYNGNLTITSPFFDGSLLIGAGYDSAKGDFKYYNYSSSQLASYDPLKNGRPGWRNRRSNQFNNTDLLLKWQSNNWLVQASWTENDRFFPVPTSELFADGYDPQIPGYIQGTNAIRWQQINQKTLIIGWNSTFWNRLNINIRFNYLDYKRIYENKSPLKPKDIFPGEQWATYRTERLSPVIDASFKLTEWNLLEFHSEFANEKYSVIGNSWSSINFHNTIDWKLKPYYKITNWYIQAQDTFTIDKNDSFWLTLLGRAQKVEGSEKEYDGSYIRWTDAQWKYSWGAALKKEFPSIGLTAQATYGTFYRYPSFYEMYGDGVFVRPGAGIQAAAAYGIDRPDWEHGMQWDAGVSWRGHFVGADHYLAATYFNREIEDLITFVTMPSYWVIYQNVGKGEVEGFEFEGNASWPLLSLYFSATWMKAELTEVETMFRGSLGLSNGPMINQPEWEYLARVDLTLPWLSNRVKLFAEHRFLDKIPIIIDYENKTVLYEDQISFSNFGLKLTIADGLHFVAGVNDAFNNGPEQGLIKILGGIMQLDITSGYLARSNLVDYPQQGRTWYFSAQYSF